MVPSHLTTPPVLSTLSPAQIGPIWQAAQKFEAMALGQLLAPMFETVDLSKSAFGGGAAEQTWRPMLTDAMAKQVTQAGGLGIAAPVFAQMIRMQEAKEAQP